MISCDTNVLFASLEVTRPFHRQARDFLEGHRTDSNFALCEPALLELYVLLRNPVICRHPLGARDAVSIIQTLRSNPHWDVLDHPGAASDIMKELWRLAAGRDFARRKVFDARLALTLRHHGVTGFATTNVKDFQGFGFKNVWNPLEEK